MFGDVPIRLSLTATSYIIHLAKAQRAQVPNAVVYTAIFHLVELRKACRSDQ